MHVAAHVAKGYLNLKSKRANEAIGAFKRALQLAPDMRNYAGLVAGYLLLSRVKEATATAKEAVRLMPNSALSHALLGDVEAISIRPATARASRFNPSQDQFTTIRYLSLFVLPELIAVFGVFAWWRRRRAPGR